VNHYNKNSAINGAELKQNPAAGAGPAEAAPGAKPGRSGFAVAAVLIIAVSLALRFAFITRYEIWLDEAYCFAVASRPVCGILAALRLDNGPPLYYILLHFWMRLFGESALALRSLSALFSAGAVAVVLFWRTPWFTRPARTAAGFILAVTPLALYYAQEARMYSPVLFFCLLSVVFLERGLRAGGTRNWCLFALLTAVSLYMSYVAIFLVPLGYVAALAAAFGENRRAALRRFGALLCAHAAAAALFLPWLPVFLEQPRAEAIQWIKRLPGNRHPAAMALESLSVMTVGGARYPSYLRQLRMDQARYEATLEQVKLGREKRPLPRLLVKVHPTFIRLLGAALTIALLATALSRAPGKFPARTFLVTWVLVPIAVPLLLSIQRPMYIVGRYEVTALPAMAMLAGIGLARLKKPVRAGGLALAGVLALYSWGWAQSFPETGVQPERGAYIAQIAGPGDVVVAEAFEYAPIYYYAGAAARQRVKFITYPRDTINHSAWIDYERWLKPVLDGEAARMELYQEARLTVEEAIEAAEPSGRIIVVRPRPPLPPPPWAAAMEEPLAAALEDLAPERLVLDRALSRPRLRILVFAPPR